MHPSTRDAAGFAATRWSMVLAAADQQPGAKSRRALEELARLYWYPLYAYIRRHGHDAPTAEDLTQEFFARLIEKQSLAAVDRSKGKFRSFLLASVKHFLANEWDKQRAQKRGGGVRVIPLDAQEAESRYAVEPADDQTPERLFERRWALAVLDQVLLRLRAQYQAKGQTPLFEALKYRLTAGGGAPRYAELAQELGMTPNALMVASHRLRRQYREMLWQEIAQTVASPELIDDEIGYLMNCL
jgi:RNA polymerase sigma-70 factor (ECF subfamily)